ncbi:DUF4240 domain-containing protein [Diaphorobacter sp. HDW4B]|uniref:DUF4240 domain-containing protein n=1 Tax=Diaphorobacter sp. HDW4B TaxID=2714925 RepID=UPI001408C983|nr:DUF4240 domain-containing protein [Diaphorobacter sp. HDW4B]QIL73053.1 DUF4240 domain-containing protein [Diaphorobacter sp. HDW4B]
MVNKRTTLLCFCLISLVACSHDVNVNLATKTMSEIRFWSLIEQAKGSGGDLEHAHRLTRLLVQLQPTEIIEFQILLDQFHSKASLGDLWAAGALLNNGHATDDGFEYFRYWLIAQGEQRYLRALSNPDSLADLHDATKDKEQSNAEWESYGAAPYQAYLTTTGKNIHAAVQQQLTQGNKRFPTSSFNLESYPDDDIKKRLPRLWKKYGMKATESASLQASSDLQTIEIAGLGRVSVGDYLTHKKLGAGKVVKLIDDGSHVTGILVFGDNERPMLLSGDFSKFWVTGRP